MSISLDILCFAVPLIMLFSAVLSVVTGVGGCCWPISARAVLIDVAFWKFPNSPPNYSYVVNAITFLILLNYKCTGPFSGGIVWTGVFYFGPRGENLPDLLRASGSNM